MALQKRSVRRAQVNATLLLTGDRRQGLCPKTVTTLLLGLAIVTFTIKLDQITALFQYVFQPWARNFAFQNSCHDRRSSLGNPCIVVLPYNQISPCQKSIKLGQPPMRFSFVWRSPWIGPQFCKSIWMQSKLHIDYWRPPNPGLSVEPCTPPYPRPEPLTMCPGPFWSWKLPRLKSRMKHRPYQNRFAQHHQGESWNRWATKFLSARSRVFNRG